MQKKLFQKTGDIHFGVNAPEGFEDAEISNVEKTLSDLGERKLWRCTVCNDIHIGKEFPHECPTCIQLDAYVEINKKELKEVIGI